MIRRAPYWDELRTFVEVGSARLQDFGSPVECFHHDVTHRNVDLSLGRPRRVNFGIVRIARHASSRSSKFQSRR
jgi:hypothetical protein